MLGELGLGADLSEEGLHLHDQQPESFLKNHLELPRLHRLAQHLVHLLQVLKNLHHVLAGLDGLALLNFCVEMSLFGAVRTVKLLLPDVLQDLQHADWDVKDSHLIGGFL